MNPVAHSYLSSDEINVIYTSYTESVGSSIFREKKVDWQSIRLKFLTKLDCLALLHQLKGALIAIEPEKFSSEEIKKHKQCIEKIETHISETWPDYKVMYESWKSIAQKAGDDFYNAKQEVYSLQRELEELKSKLLKAQKKIVHLKKKQNLV